MPLQENMLTESWILQADKNDLNAYLKLDGSNQMSSNLRMNGKRITGLTKVPDFNGYLKLDGSTQMQGNLEMNNNRITRLPEPQLADEPATKRYVGTTMLNSYNIFLDLQGN